MLVNSAVTIYQGSTPITKVYQGNIIVWGGAPTGSTIIHYKSVRHNTLNLITSTTVYEHLVSNTYDTENDLGTIVLNTVLTSLPIIFTSMDSVTYFEVPASITHIENGALIFNLYWEYGGVDLVALPEIAPELEDGAFGYFNNHINIKSFTYPENSNYIYWYFNKEGQYKIKLAEYYRTIGICPQCVRYEGYGTSDPTITTGWDGEYLGKFYWEGISRENTECYFGFSKRIINVPSKAFYYYKGNTRFGFPDCTKVIGSEAFYGANINHLPRMRGVETIKSYAFARDYNDTQGYSEIQLPASVKTIENYAFNYANATNISIYGGYISGDSRDIFYDIKSGGTMYYNQRYHSIYDNWIIRDRQGRTNTWSKREENASLIPANRITSGLYFQATSNTITINYSLGFTDAGDNVSIYLKKTTPTGESTFVLEREYYQGDITSSITVNVETNAYYYLDCIITYADTEINRIDGAKILVVYNYRGGIDGYFQYNGNDPNLICEYYEDDYWYNNTYKWK